MIGAGTRPPVATSPASIGEAQLKKIPYMLVVGEREAAEGKVAVRLRSGKNLGAIPLDAFIARSSRKPKRGKRRGGLKAVPGSGLGYRHASHH